jgi:hypothetical protein
MIMIFPPAFVSMISGYHDIVMKSISEMQANISGIRIQSFRWMDWRIGAMAANLP